MSFDKPARNALAKMVGECRKLLTADVRDQLQRTYGLQPEGTNLLIERLGHLDEAGRQRAQALREWLDHTEASEAGREADRRKAAFERITYETAFTALNRLAALRMCEERELVLECVRRGMESDGFILYEKLAGGALGTRGETYRVFLERMFDELAVDLGALFDRRTPQSLVFPGERCLEEGLAVLNDSTLSHLWKEDETIGWIYQYFNSKEEREAMRKASQAPRNSRELAVRNQFFTPRYVVEFLTDNTLGRTWYEMRQGDTRLKTDCRYLVQRPTEIFLKQGEKPPKGAEPTEDLSQEELVKQPVYTPFRPKKDLRDVKVLDPACGSGHFLLYAYDLLETVYGEAWADEGSPPSQATGKTLREDYPDLDVLRQKMPGLILRHNLFGIDIDLRACQIAALALWLRAQRSYQKLDLKAGERPHIMRSNIVCAEPMPGEKDMLQEFAAKLQPKVLGQLVEVVFEKMTLADEAGSLLKIEEEIRGAIAEAKRQWLASSKQEQMTLFPEYKRPKLEQMTLFDVSEITDEQFWTEAEGRILDALREYAEGSGASKSFQRRLFSEDVAEGFALIDVCRHRFDTVLMNPPFGLPVATRQNLMTGDYITSKNDLLGMFVLRGLSLLNPAAPVGVITARTCLFLGDFAAWRAKTFLGNRISCLADLGLGVMDDALVEACCYVLERRAPVDATGFYAKLLSAEDKEAALLQAVRASGDRWANVTVTPQSLFGIVPGNAITYWAPTGFIGRFRTLPSFERVVSEVRQGLATADDFRFARLAWEVSEDRIGEGRDWAPFAKGGEYSPLYDDIHMLVNWQDDGSCMKEYVCQQYPYLNGNWSFVIKNVDCYFKPGVTYTVRTTSAFCPKILPRGCIFSHNAQSWFGDQNVLLASIGLMLSRVAQAFIELMVGSGDTVSSGSAARRYTTLVIASVPTPELLPAKAGELAGIVQQYLQATINKFESDETSRHFNPASLFIQKNASLNESCEERYRITLRNIELALRCSQRIDGAISELYGLSGEEQRFVETEIGRHPLEYHKVYDANAFNKLAAVGIDELVDIASAYRGSHRVITKKTFWADRRVEVMSHSLGCSAERVIEGLASVGPNKQARSEHCRQVLSFGMGVLFGRWDVRCVTKPWLCQRLRDAFSPPPACSPGMLQSPGGFPAGPGTIVSEEWMRICSELGMSPAVGSVEKPVITIEEYPLRVSWDGILVDDAGVGGIEAHREDVVRRVREVLHLLWEEKAEAIEHEVTEILQFRDLREYFRKPTGFFADHLSRYSKSRRRAPIYWPLSTASGSYTLWVYYHRLSDDLFYKAVNGYVQPKIGEVERGVVQIEMDLPKASGREAARLRDRLDETRAFLVELGEFRVELLRVAGLPYRPNLNDGVVITASPLWKLFRLPKWRKDLEACWKKLEAGEYDWSHLAYSIWPERVREVCKRNRSIAIAHGLEEICEAPVPKVSKRKRRVPYEKEGHDLLGDDEDTGE